VYLELDGNGALYAQLTRALKAAILAGRVAAGARLPATRVLSREMDLSRNTVLAAYEQLHAEGFLVGKVGSGSYVAEIESARRPRAAPRVVPTSPVARYAKRARDVFDDVIPGRQYKGLRYNLQYGLPLTNPTLTSAWRRALAQASAHAELDYPEPQGLPELREQICDYLARRRGIVCAPEDLLVVYLPDHGEWTRACLRMRDAGFVATKAFNPYWNRRGRTFVDPDGYQVVLEQDTWPDSPG